MGVSFIAQQRHTLTKIFFHVLAPNVSSWAPARLHAFSCSCALVCRMPFHEPFFDIMVFSASALQTSMHLSDNSYEGSSVRLHTLPRLPLFNPGGCRVPTSPDRPKQIFFFLTSRTTLYKIQIGPDGLGKGFLLSWYRWPRFSCWSRWFPKGVPTRFCTEPKNPDRPKYLNDVKPIECGNMNILF